MLQAPTSEAKTETMQSKSQFAPQPERELHPHPFGAAGTYYLSGARIVASACSPEALQRHPLTAMQSTYGNQAVLRMLHSPQQVARMPALRPSQNMILQRKCACGGSSETEGECAECKAKREGTLQRRAPNQGVSPTRANAAPPIVYDVLRSPGQPLDAGTRALMEPRFGYDFSHVRVHTDARAAESARGVNALAYTVGKNVVFGAGQYLPESNSGRHLIAHELTHVLQQSNGAISDWGVVSEGIGISDPNDSFEQRADETASRIFSSTLPGTDGSQLRSLHLGVMNTLQRQATNQSQAEVSSSRGAPIVEDGQLTAPGQMQRSEFLTTLRDRLITECEAELSPVGRSARGCPYILRAIERYSTRPLSSMLRFIQLFAHPPVDTDASGLIDAVSQRARAAARRLAANSGQRLQAMTESDNGRLPPHDPMAIRAQLGNGNPFNGPTRDQMEQSFGTSFSSLRIHTDAIATHLNAELGARAFTIGNNIAFASGQYRPGTLAGDVLIAHELAHTLQQGTKMPNTSNNVSDRELERQADHAAIAAVTGREGVGSSLQATGRGIHIQRDGVGEIALAAALFAGAAAPIASEAEPEIVAMMEEAAPLVEGAAPLVSQAAPLVSQAAPFANEASTLASSSSVLLTTATVIGVGVAGTTLPSDSPTKEKTSDKPTEENTCTNTFPNLILCEKLPMDYQFANGYQDAKQKFPKGTKFENPPKEVNNPKIPCYGKGGTHRQIKDSNGNFLGSLICCPCCLPTSVGPAKQEFCTYRAKGDMGDRYYKQNP